MNKPKNQSMDDYIEERLVEWANWYRKDYEGGIGYPRKSHVNMIIDGVFIERKKHRSKKPLPNHEKAEEMEAYICEMYEHKPMMANAIRLHYLDHLSLRVNAKKLRLSFTQFKQYILMGKQWLAGRLKHGQDKTTFL